MNHDEKPKRRHPWVEAARKRGCDGLLHSVLDIFEPFGGLFAQILWIAQPFAALFSDRETLHQFAQLLETPEGIEELRRQLEAPGEDWPRLTQNNKNT